MFIIIYDGKGIVPELIKIQFKKKMSENLSRYVHLKDDIVSIETDQMFYRLKFTPYLDSEIAIVEVLDYMIIKK